MRVDATLWLAYSKLFAIPPGCGLRKGELGRLYERARSYTLRRYSGRGVLSCETSAGFWKVPPMPIIGIDAFLESGLVLILQSRRNLRRLIQGSDDGRVGA